MTSLRGANSWNPLDGFVEAIAKLIEYRTRYADGHIREVAELACAIGAELGCSEHMLDGLRVMGHVYDIGKMRVPIEILVKPIKLTPLELNIARQHAETGYAIFKDINFQWPVAKAIQQHHEHLDGSGYPKGLRGDEICLEAKILGVAITCKTLTAQRPYRPALSVDAALDELVKGRDKLYDTAAVDACVKLLG